MISPDLIAKHFGVNYRVIHRQIEGLSHEDSLLPPPFRGNCLNWVLGHIVASRNGVLKALGQDPIWSAAEAAPYIPDSAPITGPEDPHLPFEKIVTAFNQSQETILATLETATQADMDQVVNETATGERLAFLFWHEAYHVGQTEYLRQLAGKDDKVI
jgi:uncharacterized damage-inducible protein DinB